MPPSREMAFMGMMEKFLETHTACDCPDCKSSTKRFRKLTAQVSMKDLGKENCSPSKIEAMPKVERHFCPDHRPPPPPRKPSAKDKDKEKDKDKDKEKPTASASTAQPDRVEKINKLLKADTPKAVLEVLNSTAATPEENKLAGEIQRVAAQCKTFTEAKSKILAVCQDPSVEADAAFGLVAKFRQERNIVSQALVKSNSEREKCLQAIHEVDDLMGMLRDVAKDGKGPSGEDIRHSLGNMIFKIHELAKNPSSLYEELLDLREEHLDLLADHEEQNQKFMDIESCHEKLHEDKKRLQEDLAWEKREHIETKRKLGSLSGTKNEVNQAHKSLEKVHEENADLKRELEKLAAELGKVNALKHENGQLKKKLAAAEVVKPEPKLEEKIPEPVAAGKKKKGKKGPAPTTNAGESAHLEPMAEKKEELAREKELKALQQMNSEVQSQLDNAQTNLRQLEALLRKAEVAKTKALERQQIEQATAQNWKDLSEGHHEESNRLKEQLDESMTNANNLQNNVHRLEQLLAESKEQLDKLQLQRRPASPSAHSQTSSTSRIEIESLRMLRKLHGEAAQLVQDLDAAKSYPGDPWNLVDCTRNMVAAIDQDLESLLAMQREPETPNPIPDTYLPFPRNDLGLQTPLSMPRRTDTPPLSSVRSRPTPTYHRPLLPPGLSESSVGRVSPTPAHLPSPIGTGRPSKNGNGPTPSPTNTPAKPAASLTPSTPSIGNGAAGVDWSIWAKGSS